MACKGKRIGRVCVAKMNKLYYCNNSTEIHYVYAKNPVAAAHKFKERFKRLFGKWNFNPFDIKEIKKPLMNPKIIEERKKEIAIQIADKLRNN